MKYLRIFIILIANLNIYLRTSNRKLKVYTYYVQIYMYISKCKHKCIIYK